MQVTASPPSPHSSLGPAIFTILSRRILSRPSLLFFPFSSPLWLEFSSPPLLSTEKGDTLTSLKDVIDRPPFCLGVYVPLFSPPPQPGTDLGTFFPSPPDSSFFSGSPFSFPHGAYRTSEGSDPNPPFGSEDINPLPTFDLLFFARVTGPPWCREAEIFQKNTLFPPSSKSVPFPLPNGR